MPIPGTETFVEDMLRTDRTDRGLLTAQLGDVIAESAESQQAEVWQSVGFASRPSKATAGSAAAQAVTIRTSLRDLVVATRDSRSAEMYGQLSDGETALYAAGATGTAQARVLLKDDGTINLVTTDDNTSSGQTHLFQFGPEGMKILTKWGYIVFDENGITFVTMSNGVGKASFRIGTDGIIQAGVASTFSIETSTVMLGAGATVASR